MGIDLNNPGAAPPIRGRWLVDRDTLDVYAESAGVARIAPLAVAVPVDGRDVQDLLAWAAAQRVAIIPRGSGSSMAGGAVGAGVVVDLSRLDTLGAVDAGHRRVRAAPGVTRGRVERSAEALGLRFPVDPSSGSFATVGGMAATNAAGARTLAFGAMRAWVTALDCVFADGSRAMVRRGEPLPQGSPTLERWRAIAPPLRDRARALPPRKVRKESSGYGVHDFAESGDLVDLLVGSEGTLACFVDVELALAPLPAATASVLTAWRSTEDSVVGAAIARAHGAVACELLDRTFLDVASSGGASLPIPQGTESVLLIELEGTSSDEAAARARAIARASEERGALGVQLGLDAESEEALWTLRHAASPILARLDPHLKSMQIVEDGCVPPDRLGDYVRGVRAALHAEALRGVIFGHAGDAHVHVNALVDVRDGDWRARIGRFADAVVALTVTLGGTLAGEHGDGRLRTPWMPRTWSPEALSLFADIKDAFDPLGILNPGVKVPAHGVDVLEANKYDPALPQPSPRAREVLARVERERAYDVSRLELLDGTG